MKNMHYEITTVNGDIVLIDVEDYKKLSKYKWYTVENQTGIVYVVRYANHKTIAMHREIMSPPKGKHVDHIDRNGLNNLRSNLRICTPSQNLCNAKKRRDNTSGFKGVSFYKRTGKWEVSIKKDYKTKHLGHYATAEEAAKVYDKAAKELHGQYAVLNFPDA